jgi:pimeloyl-ACP methyl ester carboxylesterase
MSPDINLDVFNDDRAKAGGEALARDLRSWTAIRDGEDASLNVVAHSYGTTTAAYALASRGVQVDAFVSLGSAGIPASIGSARDLQVARMFAGQAQNVIPAIEDGAGDQWAWVGRSGSGGHDPMDPQFGAIRFGTDGDSGNDLHKVTGHSTSLNSPDFGYLDIQTESLRNSALATTNQQSKISPHIEPGLTETQKLLVDSPWSRMPNVR